MSTYGLWLSAAGMKVNDHRQTIHANNLANAQTTGFKHDLAVVAQRRVESRESVGGGTFAHGVLDGLAGGIQVLPSQHTFEQGPIERTGRPLDVAIDGNGFFAVTDGTSTRFTRDGEFTTNAANELVLSAGNGKWKVMDESGGTIRVDETAGAIAISGRGTVKQGQQEVARIGVYAPSERTLMRKTGENLFDPNGAEMSVYEARLAPESREESTYDVMNGLTAMIEASRAYQMNATLLQLQDQMTGTLVTSVGRVA